MFASNTYQSTCHRCQEPLESWWHYCPNCGTNCSTSSGHCIVIYGRSAGSSIRRSPDPVRRERERTRQKQDERQRRFEERGHRGKRDKPGRLARREKEDREPLLPEWWDSRLVQDEGNAQNLDHIERTAVGPCQPPPEAGLLGHPARAPPLPIMAGIRGERRSGPPRADGASRSLFGLDKQDPMPMLIDMMTQAIH